MGRREEETRKAIKEAKKETFVGTKERIMHEIAISLAVIADMMTDKAESEEQLIKAIMNGTPIPDNATNICGDICGDNRFEIIAKAKEDIISATNIEVAKDEMECLDSFLFRCWQMGWLDKYAPYQKGGKE